MKLSLRIILCFFICSSSLYAQASDTYDIATFTPPTGWKKQTKEGAVLFTTADEKKGTFCLLTIYASNKSSGDAKRDFESDWQEFIAGPLHVTKKPEIDEQKTDSAYNAVNANGELVP